MQVRELMTPNVECAAPEDTIAQAAQRMKQLDVGMLPVCGRDDRLVGTITDRDITIRATAESRSPDSTYVGDVMTDGIHCCFDDQDIREAIAIMEEKQIRRIIVLDRNKQLVGIVSLGDLAVKLGDNELSGEALEQVSEPASPAR